MSDPLQHYIDETSKPMYGCGECDCCGGAHKTATCHFEDILNHIPTVVTSSDEYETVETWHCYECSKWEGWSGEEFMQHLQKLAGLTP